MEVFHANILIELKENESIIVEVNTDHLSTRLCTIKGIGQGYYDVASDSYRKLPWKVGDEVYVKNNQWDQVKHLGDTYLITRAEFVMARVS
jgi:co-chaperonin GroES (HSP10)